jgi:hypothetical protein
MMKWVAGEELLEKGGRRKEEEKTAELVPSPCSLLLAPAVCPRACYWLLGSSF